MALGCRGCWGPRDDAPGAALPSLDPDPSLLACMAPTEMTHPKYCWDRGTPEQPGEPRLQSRRRRRRCSALTPLGRKRSEGAEVGYAQLLLEVSPVQLWKKPVSAAGTELHSTAGRRHTAASVG
ncbi:uncharacterized protein LOC128155100 isoform X2 [Harpia harpyja]|uniref:uncharacterized protein LOC128155100 isoform X2 n=1 Tax=Harpia harpyja TaxID=202280 RepID=UPI0022B10867|nr:uncharacterized protein LOC128155100 isoform X2 [Harpia harpyja]